MVRLKRSLIDWGKGRERERERERKRNRRMGRQTGERGRKTKMDSIVLFESPP